MVVHVNLWAVLVGGLASMVIGAIYYADPVFGKLWKNVSGADVKKFEKDFPKLAPFIFIANLVLTYAVAYMAFLYHAYKGRSWLASGLIVALILWLGIAVTTLFIHSSMDQKPKKLIYLAVGNRFLTMLASGVIVGLMHP